MAQAPVFQILFRSIMEVDQEVGNWAADTDQEIGNWAADTDQ